MTCSSAAWTGFFLVLPEVCTAARNVWVANVRRLYANAGRLYANAGRLYAFPLVFKKQVFSPNSDNENKNYVKTCYNFCASHSFFVFLQFKIHIAIWDYLDSSVKRSNRRPLTRDWKRPRHRCSTSWRVQLPESRRWTKKCSTISKRY